MSVEFNEMEGISTPRYATHNNTSRITNLIINYSGGLIKDEKQAQYLLLIISILAIITSLFFILGTKDSKQQPVKPMVYAPTINLKNNL